MGCNKPVATRDSNRQPRLKLAQSLLFVWNQATSIHDVTIKGARREKITVNLLQPTGQINI